MEGKYGLSIKNANATEMIKKGTNTARLRKPYFLEKLSFQNLGVRIAAIERSHQVHMILKKLLQIG